MLAKYATRVMILVTLQLENMILMIIVGLLLLLFLLDGRSYKSKGNSEMASQNAFFGETPTSRRIILCWFTLASPQMDWMYVIGGDIVPMQAVR